MANYENNDKQSKSFGQRNYGQRFLPANRQSEIVSPINLNKGFDYAKAINKFEKRLPAEDASNDNEPAELDFSDQQEEPTEEETAGNQRTDGENVSKISSLLNKFAKDKKTTTAVATLVKAKNLKIYLIGGGIVLGILFIFIIFFAVFSAGGTEASGMNFIEVSEYELDETDNSSTDSNETVVSESDTVVNKDSEGNNGELVQ